MSKEKIGVMSRDPRIPGASQTHSFPMGVHDTSRQRPHLRTRVGGKMIEQLPQNAHGPLFPRLARREAAGEAGKERASWIRSVSDLEFCSAEEYSES